VQSRIKPPQQKIIDKLFEKRPKVGNKCCLVYYSYSRLYLLDLAFATRHGEPWTPMESLIPLAYERANEHPSNTLPLQADSSKRAKTTFHWSPSSSISKGSVHGVQAIMF
jgi:hypothetical protein